MHIYFITVAKFSPPPYFDTNSSLYFHSTCIVNHNYDHKDIEMKKNEVYGVSMAAGQPQIQDNTLMSKNVCYVTTQHMEMVGNECYSCVSEK